MLSQIITKHNQTTRDALIAKLSKAHFDSDSGRASINDNGVQTAAIMLDRVAREDYNGDYSRVSKDDLRAICEMLFSLSSAYFDFSA